LIRRSIAVTHDQDAQLDTHTEEHKPFFIVGVLGVRNNSGVFI
jgi:hypothetical protein